MQKNNFKVLELKSSKNKNTIKRSILIKDFTVNEIIGIHKHEKINKQKIIFNIVIDVNQNTLRTKTIYQVLWIMKKLQIN